MRDFHDFPGNLRHSPVSVRRGERSRKARLEWLESRRVPAQLGVLAAVPPPVATPPSVAPVEKGLGVHAEPSAPTGQSLVFAPIASQTVYQTQPLQATFQAADAAHPAAAMRYSVEPGSPPEAHIDSATGVLTWNVPLDYPVGPTTLTVRATQVLPNGPTGPTATQALAVQVRDIGAAQTVFQSTPQTPQTLAPVTPATTIGPVPPNEPLPPDLNAIVTTRPQPGLFYSTLFGSDAWNRYGNSSTSLAAQNAAGQDGQPPAAPQSGETPGQTPPRQSSPPPSDRRASVPHEVLWAETSPQETPIPPAVDAVMAEGGAVLLETAFP